MIIAISARNLRSKPHDGVSRFTYETVRRLVQTNRSHEFILIFDREYDRSLLFSPNCTGVILKPGTTNPLNCYLWHEIKLPPLLKKLNAGIFLSPDGIISLRTNIPQIAVIHDISFYHRRGDLPLFTGIYYRHYYRRFARRAARIITVSEFCRQDISSYFGIDPSVIDVAWNGVSEYFRPATEEEKDQFRMSLTGGVPYFLFVGNFSPRKNIPSLIKAWHLFRQETGMNHRLVLAGGRLFLNSETDRMITLSPWRDDIILPGSVDHSSLRLYYAAAEALVFVPWFEGFGIPAAEAMRCGTPVILSSSTSLPEIGGDAALFADPGNPEEICGLMIKIATGKKLKERLSAGGIIQSCKFTWENTAESVNRSLQKLL